MIHHTQQQRSIQYRIGPRNVTAHIVSRRPGRLGGLSIFELTQAANNASIAQANAESSGDYAAAAAANAQATALQAQLTAVYANATPPDKQAQVSYVLAASAPTPVTIAPPPPPPPAPPVLFQPPTYTPPVSVIRGQPVIVAALPPATSGPQVVSVGASSDIFPAAWDSSIQSALPTALQGNIIGSVPKWAAIAGLAGAYFWFKK